jgi:cytochrome c-type biogenesis protein CcmH
MTSRRDFLSLLASGTGAVVFGARLGAQQQGPVHDSSLVPVTDTTNLFAMNQMAARPVRLPPKPGATPSMTPLQRDALERRIHCQCGCTLDVFTCRTTDFSCQVSPAMHRDVMSLVEGGYGAQEIIDAFESAYGERVLMSPRKSGFNLVGWFAPGVALAVGAVVVGWLIRRWGRAGEHPVSPAAVAPPIDATPDELARLEAAVRGDGDA